MAQLTTTVNTLNFSSTPGYSPKISWSAGVAPTVVMSICFLLGFPGNIAVIILKPDWETMSSLSQSLMLSLAVSDLLCMLTIPVWIYSFLNNWMISLVSCKLITYFVYCTIYGSLLTVTLLSVQRYLQVVHLQRSLNRVEARKLLVPLWLAAMILSTPELVVRKLVEQQHWTKCKNKHSSDGQRLAVVLTETLVVFLSLSVIMFTYIGLYRKVNRAAFFNNPQTTRLITRIIVTSVVLWMPYLSVNVLGVAAISLKNGGLLKFCEDSWSIVGALTFINSALNPLLYAFTSIRLTTLRQKLAEQLIQKFKNSQNLTLSTDISAEATSQC
ncbi:C-C chemokine receptor type 8-like [Oreochromis niloticus]|uniref:C-C chemokine receptor type 8-like n=1 Tax=Oreochromis niloticus TaxID=8128 RepID=UPI000904B0CF|nr:C-C chemokine receptor type 8-like [Oreochromis niloticus]